MLMTFLPQGQLIVLVLLNCLLKFTFNNPKFYAKMSKVDIITKNKQI